MPELSDRAGAKDSSFSRPENGELSELLSSNEIFLSRKISKNDYSHDLGIHVNSLLSRTLSADKSEREDYEDRPHKYLRDQCEFNENTAPFLSRYSARFHPFSQHDGSRSFYVPIHGITNRTLPGNDSDDLKYYRAVMEVDVPIGAHNIDQCHFKRGPRQEETKEQYLKELAEELNGAADLPSHKGPLSFFTHGAFTAAGVADHDALRLAMLSGIPTINVDWRSSSGPWFTLPFRYPIDYFGAVAQEKVFEDALDTSFAFIGPAKSTFVSFSRGTAFDAAYMRHRFEDRANCSPLAANIFAHADLPTSTFNLRQDGVNPTVAGSKNSIVMGSTHDFVLKIGKFRIFEDRVGDAEPSDIKAVTEAGGKYVLDDYKRRGGNFNHYVDYKVIAKIIKTASDASLSPTLP